MASITIRNLPDDVHRRLREIAKQGGRSLNQEIVQQLRAAITRVPSAEEVEEQIQRVRRHGKKLLASGYIPPSPKEIVAMIRKDRESH